ncbi:37S ribosomal protein MRP4, mitochondrial [Ceratocystis fimbriata CBS 114723]|uniref:37S ribosomal protein MRP4, mitochondrial n=1 Tax=Ceratocystis fimbriata CBS 114723 TaxID=1035309 RepID=A0A2C5X437_9PEZI|nr:37S ribosomal protein MRP4, mitochondrial [Ceratocystis fimbriata CBS 114723]
MMITRKALLRQGYRLAVGSNTCYYRALTTRSSLPASTPASDTPATQIPIPREAIEAVEEEEDKGPKIPGKPVASYENSLVKELMKLANTENNQAFRKNHARNQNAEAQLGKLGSDLTVAYSATQMLKSPPTAQQVTLEMLMAAQTHMGHNAKVWNPANSRYIYGIRHGIHIISLEQTLAHLRRAARVVEEVAYRGGTILFVGTRKGHMEIVSRAATKAKACYLFTRWTPGSITNRDRLLEGLKVYAVNERDELLAGFEKHVDDSRPLTPDLVVCLNPIENYTLLYECGLAKIPTIGYIDTDADASWVTYPIPANDDSLRAATLLTGVLGRAGQIGQGRRLAEASQGICTWETPSEVAKFLEKTVRHRKKVLSSDLTEAKTASISKTKRDGGDVDAQKELWKMVEAKLLGHVEPLPVEKLGPEEMMPEM